MTQRQIPTQPVNRQTSGRDRDPRPSDPPPPPESKDEFDPPNMDPHGDGDGGKDYY